MKVSFAAGAHDCAVHQPIKATKVLKEIKPPIPLKLLVPMELTKGQYHLHKLCMVPADANSATYELSALYFSNGLVEQWLHFHKSLKRVCMGQNATTRPSVHAVARCLLEGDTLCAFNIKVAEAGNKTLANFEKCLTAVAKNAFPKCATQAQK